MDNTNHRRLRAVLSAILPTGAIGVSLALAPSANAAPVVTAPDRAADTHPDGSQSSVAARLEGIRNAVSDVIQTETDHDPNIHEAWWGNWHRGFGGWGNGGGWRRGWGNGGWGNGGWHNGGWGNGGWHNGGWGNGGWGNWHG